MKPDWKPGGGIRLPEPASNDVGTHGMASQRLPVTAGIIDPVILLYRGSEVIFDENFSDHLEGMPPHQRLHWLEERSALLLDEHDDGAFDTNGELDPWEPD